MLLQRTAHTEVIIGLKSFEIGAQLVAISFNSPVSGKHMHLNMLSLQEPVRHREPQEDFFHANTPRGTGRVERIVHDLFGMYCINHTLCGQCHSTVNTSSLPGWCSCPCREVSCCSFVDWGAGTSCVSESFGGFSIVLVYTSCCVV